MKSREELRDVMADAICDASLDVVRNEYSCLIQGHGQSMMDVARILADAALEALCGALPEPLTTSRSGKIIRSIDKADEYYNQLKQYGEK
jgi:hypothetical protein